MKIFRNDRTDLNNELPIRKGNKVPEGAVSLGWYKTPDLSPQNNLATIDTSRFELSSDDSVTLAYANALGILEDEYGNQAWPEEFPIVGDQFLFEENVVDPSQALPYVHISRHFHLDRAALAFAGSPTEVSPTSNLKITDKEGNDYLGEEGAPRYKIFLVNIGLDDSLTTTTGLYRVWVFLDTDPIEDELYLTYHKAEYDNGTNYFRDEFIGFKEPLSAHEYYRYTPEESEVVDQGSNDRKIYSTNPIDFKDQVIGRSQPSYKGWQIQVPKKAIPDPRKFELFRWRIAGSYSRSVDPNETVNDNKPTPINVGVVTFNSNFSSQSRSNYIFQQLNESSFNTGGFDFINPLKENNTELGKSDAEYWSVPINDLTNPELDEFDVLVWSSSSKDIDIGDSIMQKIRYFVETHGGTFIFETCSRSNFNGIPGVSFSPTLKNLTDATTVDRVTVDDLSYYTHTYADANSTTSGTYSTWPVPIEDQFTGLGSNHSSDVLRNLNSLGGWDLDEAEEQNASAYMSLVNSGDLSFQSIASLDEDWEVILESKRTDSEVVEPVFARNKFTSGGSYYVSTACLFEDHLISSGLVGSSAYNVPSLNKLSAAVREEFSRRADSTNMQGEMKLRMNIAMLSTAFRPSTNVSPSFTDGFNQDYERHTVTIYSDWQSSWVINAHDDVLSSEEKSKFNFSLMPKSPEDTDPVWLRVLSDKTVGEIMAEKIEEINANGQNETFENLAGLTKRYAIMVTNQSVETYSPNLVDEETFPSAWTYSFSPKFEIPYDLGPYLVRQEMVAGVGVGEGKRVYPRRQFKVMSRASYVTANSEADSINVNVAFSGTAQRSYRIPPKTVRLPDPEPESLTIDSLATVGAPARRLGKWVDVKLRWFSDANPTLKPANEIWGSSRPNMSNMLSTPAISTWSDANYTGTWVNHFASWSMHSIYYPGVRGNAVRLIQRIMNQMVFWKQTPGPFLAEDGIYGPKTEASILAMQVKRKAIVKDGIVDSEAWSLMGYSLSAIYSVPGWVRDADAEIKYLGRKAFEHMRLDRVSGGNGNLGYIRQSNSSGFGAADFSETFMLEFDPAFSDNAINGGFRMSALVVQPYFYAYDKNKKANITWLDVGGAEAGRDLKLEGYNFQRASHGNIKVPMKNNDYVTIPFTDRIAKQVIFRITRSAQVGGSWGSARMAGINDAYVVARKYIPGDPPAPTPTPSPEPEPQYETIPGRTVTETVNVSGTQVFNLKTGIPKMSSLDLKNGNLINNVRITSVNSAVNSQYSIYPSSISGLNWTSYQITPATKSSLVDVQKVGNAYRLTYNDSTTTLSDPNFVLGEKIGDGGIDFWVKTLEGSVEPFSRKFGWVSKDQGVLLLTKEDGSPIGFPLATPTLSGKEANFTRLVMDSWETDQTLNYGFYDVSKNEWIENRNGEPDISYYQYIRRGVQNVYMAVQTSFEVDTKSNLPSPDEPVLRPFSTAMPIYAVKTRGEKSAKLKDPSRELSHKDIWPILVGTGSFSKKYTIDQDYADRSTNYLKNYGGKSLTAYYSLREGVRGPWSELLGRPYKDQKNEQPRLLSGDTIQVNYAPIVSIQEPTFQPVPSDPVTPLFKVYRRDWIADPWVEVPIEDIKEYDLPRGTVTLKEPLVDEDPRLIKIDYTSRDYSYRYSRDGDKKVNLNPYILNKNKDNEDHINALDKPLYVYLVPSFVVENENKTVIANTNEERIVRVTEDKSIFDPAQASYDPLAFQIGIIFTFTSVDVRDLRILDTRVRGGGAKHHLETAELEVDSSSYWDVKADDVYSYQNGGFVIIRLPVSILDDFPTEESLREVVSRNLTAGVIYKFQDYSGQPLFGN